MNFGSPLSPRLLFWLIVAILVVGSGFTINALSTDTLNANESLLVSLLLTFLSVGAGWLISHTLYQDSRKEQIAEIRAEYERNIEVYAVKASEKVINLSNQIGRVIEYLGKPISKDGPDPVLQMQARCEASVHMLETLKSINDTSLSDWEGVIGERLDAKRKIDQQRDYDINAILEEIRGLSQEITEASSDTYVSDLVRELRRVSTIEASLPPPRSVKGFKELDCPSCGHAVRLKANKNGKIGKTAASCKGCGTSLAVIGGSTSAPKLEPRRLKPELVHCVECGEPRNIVLDNVTPSQTTFDCGGCSLPMAAQRLHAGGVKVKVNEKLLSKSYASANSKQITEDFVQQVADMLPEQPWPTGVHRAIATKLGVSPSQVSKATQRLIEEGKFSPQIDGVVIN